MLKKLSAIALLMVMVFTLNIGFAGVEDDRPVVKDLSKAYEVWKTQGIKFVVRDENGKFVTWNIGRLESWGTKSKWVVRDPKGHFLTHASGNVENWKNGQTRLVLRDNKGRLLTHVRIDITDKAKALRQGALQFQRDVITREKELIGIISPLEIELKGNKTDKGKNSEIN